MKHRIAVTCRKGGVGKTSTAAGIIAQYHAHGAHVCAIDLDPQGNLSHALSASLQTSSAYELLAHGEIKPFITEDKIAVFTGGEDLTSNKIQTLDPECLADLIPQLPGEVVVIDAPPQYLPLERLATRAATEALIIADPHPFSTQAVLRVIEDLRYNKERGRTGAQRWAIIANKINKSYSSCQDLIEGLKQMNLDGEVLTVSQDAELVRATSFGYLLDKGKAFEDLGLIRNWIESEGE